MRVLIACLLLAGCASEPPMPREKQGATEEEFMQARDACMKAATAPYSGPVSAYPGSPAQEAIGCPMYDACMTGRGFQRVAGGRFYAPIVCRD
jgi:PBP1b-binding outer membrane lipoprotein LpoB